MPAALSGTDAMVLVRLAGIGDDALREVLQMSWRLTLVKSCRPAR